jgi:hypothetical protein
MLPYGVKRLLSSVSSILIFFYSQFLLSSVSPVLSSSCPQFLLSSVPLVLSSSCPQFLLSSVPRGNVVVVIVWLLDLQIPVQSVPIITTKVVSSNLAHGEVYSIQHYAVIFFSGLQQSVVFVESGDKYHNINPVSNTV